MTTRVAEAAAAEREAEAIFGRIAAARGNDGPIVPDGFEGDAEHASDLMRRARRLRAEASPPTRTPPPPPPPPAVAQPTKEIPNMAIPLANSIMAERERAKSIITEGARLGVSAAAVDAAIRTGMSAEDFLTEYDVAAALADQIAASAKAAGG